MKKDRFMLIISTVLRDRSQSALTQNTVDRTLSLDWNDSFPSHQAVPPSLLHYSLKIHSPCTNTVYCSNICATKNIHFAIICKSKLAQRGNELWGEDKGCACYLTHLKVWNQDLDPICRGFSSEFLIACLFRGHMYYINYASMRYPFMINDRRPLYLITCSCLRPPPSVCVLIYCACCLQVLRLKQKRPVPVF